MQPSYLTLGGTDLEDDLERLRRATAVEGVDNTDLHTLSVAITRSGGWRRLVFALVEAGVPVDARNRMGQTALGRAVARGNFEMTQALLECGADWMATDSEGLSPLERAWEKPGSQTQSVMDAWIRRRTLLSNAKVREEDDQEGRSRL